MVVIKILIFQETSARVVLLNIVFLLTYYALAGTMEA